MLCTCFVIRGFQQQPNKHNTDPCELQASTALHSRQAGRCTAGKYDAEQQRQTNQQRKPTRLTRLLALAAARSSAAASASCDSFFMA